MITKIFENISRVIAIYAFIISLVEEELSGKPGAEKKQQAIVYIQQCLKKLAEEGEIPLWIIGIFGSNFILGMAIDFLVELANKKGLLLKSSEKSIGN